MKTMDETAKQIVGAASKRFNHYGYGKTTMSEIAEDCNMSTGNLYRYFKSKLDIAQAFVSQIRSEQLAELRIVAQEAKLAPGERLRRFLHRKLELAYERFHGRPKAFEISENLLKERPEFAEDWEHTDGALLAEILSAGNAGGAFAIEDVVKMADTIQNATHRYATAVIFYEGELDELKAELDRIIDVFIDAFSFARGHQQSATAAVVGG